MKAIRPYISLDLETTGLDTDKSQMLQIAWVIEDGVSKSVKDLDHGSFLIRNPKIVYGENYALGMNDWIFRELMKKDGESKYEITTPMRGLYYFLSAVKQAAEMAYNFDIANGVKRPRRSVQIAGKNPANFDWPIVLNRLKQADPSTETMSEIEYSMDASVGFVDHRFMDVGAIFFEDFGRNPGLNEINKLIGHGEVTHDALDDAFNVVIAIRWKMRMTEATVAQEEHDQALKDQGFKTEELK